MDVSQLSKWKKEEDWDSRIEAIQERVGEKMGLEELRKEQDLEVPSIEEYTHLSRLRELAIMAMESVETGEVEFQTMSEVRAALKEYEEYRRLVHGKPQQGQKGETTNINISLGGVSHDPKMAVAALLSIASAAELEDSDDEDVIDVTPED